MPWYLSMAMQVIVRMPVTMAVVCTKGTVLQTRTPANKANKTKGLKNEVLGNSRKHAFLGNFASLPETRSPFRHWFHWNGHLWSPSCTAITHITQLMKTQTRRWHFLPLIQPWANCRRVLMGAHALSCPPFAMIHTECQPLQSHFYEVSLLASGALLNIMKATPGSPCHNIPSVQLITPGLYWHHWVKRGDSAELSHVDTQQQANLRMWCNTMIT